MNGNPKKQEIWDETGKYPRPGRKGVRKADRRGIDPELLFPQSLLSPATYSLANPDIEKTVENGFESIRGLSAQMREKYGLGGCPRICFCI